MSTAPSPAGDHAAPITTTSQTTYPAGALVRVDDICRRPGRDGQPAKPGLLPISQRTWYKWVKAGTVPEGRKLGSNTRAWPIEVVLAVGQRREE